MGSFWSRPEPLPRTQDAYLDSLSEGKIRLLKYRGDVLENRFSFFSKCHPCYDLITVELRDSPPFIAASYVWGSPKCTDTVVIGDTQTLPITASAKQCLNVLSRYEYIWVDSICINQSDNVEKSQQVGLMGTIYSQATEVVAILGETNSSWNIFGRASSYLETIICSMRIRDFYRLDSPAFTFQPYQPYRSYRSYQPFQPYHDASLLTGEPSRTELTFFEFFEEDYLSATVVLHRLRAHAITLEILRHPYWKRVWIIQELALARTIIIYCEGTFLPWDTFSDMLSSLDDIEHYFYTSPHRQVWEQGRAPHKTARPGEFLVGYQCLIEADTGTYVDRIFESKDRDVCLHNSQLISRIKGLRRSPKRSLKDVLVGFTHSLATDPRDKVFALLGLVAYQEGPSNTGESMITPDYNKASKEVFKETTLALIRTGDCSTHLLAGGIGWDFRSRQMPSWVVNWARPLFLDIDAENSGRRLNKFWAGLTRGLGDTEDGAFTIIDPDRILGKFIYLDRIVFISQDIRPHSRSWFLDSWETICEYLPEEYPYRQFTSPPIGGYEVLWRVLLDVPAAGGLKKHNCNDRTCEVETDAFPAGFAESNGERHLCTDLVESAFRAWAGLPHPTTPGHNRLRQSQSFEDALSRSRSNGACVAVSAKGYLGTVPPWSEVGDEIMIHIGCPMPVALRKAPRQDHDLDFRHIYRHLVGRAHFLGMMRAEWANGILGRAEIMEVFASQVYDVVLL